MKILPGTASALDGCKVLSEALQFNTSLEMLELGYNALGAAGGAYVGEALYDNRCAQNAAESHGACVYACFL